jgi:hypothetical protein
MPHLAASHDVPVQVEDILERRARVGREAEAFDAGVRRDPRSGKDKTARELDVGELRDRPDVRSRYHEHVKWRRSRLRIERDQVGIFVADRRCSCVRGDATEHAIHTSAQRNFTRPSRSGGLSASPSSTKITNLFSQCGVGYAPSLRSMFRNDPSGILMDAG